MLSRLPPVLLVALGGALGAMARFGVANGFARRFNAWPLGTLVINLTGCFLIALFMSATAERHADLPPGWRYLFPIGFVGAYTTFSTYELETLRLFERGSTAGALAYVLLSNLLGFGAVVLGSVVGRRV